MKFLNRMIEKRLSDIEKKAIEDDWNYKIKQALDEQRNIYELQIKIGRDEKDTLTEIIRKKNIKIREAEEKEYNSKQILMQAKNMIDKIDQCYTDHIESSALILNEFSNIRDKIDIFSKKLLKEK